MDHINGVGQSEVVAPVFLAKKDPGWGEKTELTTKQKPWVLYIQGVDDFSVYKLFFNKESALKTINIYLHTDVKLNCSINKGWHFIN